MLFRHWKNHYDDPIHDDLIKNIKSLLTKNFNKASDPNPIDPQDHLNSKNQPRMFQRILSHRKLDQIVRKFNREIHENNDKIIDEELYRVFGQYVKKRDWLGTMVFAEIEGIDGGEYHQKW